MLTGGLLTDASTGVRYRDESTRESRATESHTLQTLSSGVLRNSSASVAHQFARRIGSLTALRLTPTPRQAVDGEAEGTAPPLPQDMQKAHRRQVILPSGTGQGVVSQVRTVQWKVVL